MEYIIGCVSGFINGFFGMGGGILPLYSLQKKLEDKKQANATTLFIIFPLSIITLFVYIRSNTIDYNLSLKVCIGAAIGAFFGAKLLMKVKYKIILIVYTAITFFAGIMMIRG